MYKRKKHLIFQVLNLSLFFNIIALAFYILKAVFLSHDFFMSSKKIINLSRLDLKGLTKKKDLLVSGIRGKYYFNYLEQNVFTDYFLSNFENDLCNNLYGNTHSESPSAELSQETIEEVRKRILNVLGTDISSEYIVIFTGSGKQSFKLIMESFAFNKSHSFYYSSSSSSNILDDRFFPNFKGSKLIEYDINDVNNMKLNNSDNVITLPLIDEFTCDIVSRNVINELLNARYTKNNSYLIADSSSFILHSAIDLEKMQFDALILDFKKIFGYPSIACLVIKSEFLKSFEKPYFGGGTVVYALPQSNLEKLRLRPIERFEDGSLPFLSINALKYCLDFLESLTKTEVQSMIRGYHTELLRVLRSFNNDTNKIEIYTNNSPMAISFNIYKNGELINLSEVKRIFERENILASYGCHNTLIKCKELTKGKGSIILSVGWATDKSDILKIASVLKEILE